MSRALGQVDALLVDCPWSALGFLKRAASLRGDAAQSLVKFIHDGVTCRPSREGAVFAAEAWIAETMDDEAAGDYESCEEAAVMEETAEPGIELGHVEEVERLEAHIQDLELQVSRLSQQQSLPAQPAAVPQATVGLLGAVPKAGGVNAQVMQRLRDLAGAGPARLAGHERRGPQEEGDPCETVQQEKELEAADGDELDLLTAEDFFGPHPEAHVLPAEADVIHAASVLRATRAAARPAASKDAWRGRPDNFTTDTLSAQGLPREAGALRGKRDDVCRTCCCFGRRQDQFIMAVDRPCRTQLRPGAADSGPQLGQTIQPAEQSIMSVTSRSEAATKRRPELSPKLQAIRQFPRSPGQRKRPRDKMVAVKDPAAN